MLADLVPKPSAGANGVARNAGSSRAAGRAVVRWGCPAKSAGTVELLPEAGCSARQHTPCRPRNYSWADDWPEPEIRWGLCRDYWAKGYASEAVRAIKKMVAQYFPENRPQKVKGGLSLVTQPADCFG